MKKSCCLSSCAIPLPQCETGAAAFPRIGLGLFFAAFGLMKLMGTLGGDPMVAGMVAGIFGVSGALLSILVWTLILSELMGGIFVVLGKIVPKVLFQLSLISFIIIDIVSMTTIHAGNVKQQLWHGFLLLVIIGVLLGKPKCPFGITGDTCGK